VTGFGKITNKFWHWIISKIVWLSITK